MKERHMTSSDLQLLQDKLRTFTQARDWQQFHSPKNLACALSVEASELLEHFQWMPEEQSRTLAEDKKSAVAFEMADIFCYLLHIAEQLDIDLVNVTSQKIDLNEKRYPADLARGNSAKYSTLNKDGA
jgi:dCTP diphosphatase